jgi:hypothetical protein
MVEYCINEKGQLNCPTYDDCHHRGICLASAFCKAKAAKCSKFEVRPALPGDWKFCKSCGGLEADHVLDIDEAKIEEILRICAIELDPEEIIELTPQLKVKRSELEMMKKIALAEEKRRKEEAEEDEYMSQPDPPMSPELAAKNRAIFESILGITAHRKKKQEEEEAKKKAELLLQAAQAKLISRTQILKSLGVDDETVLSTMHDD